MPKQILYITSIITSAIFLAGGSYLWSAIGLSLTLFYVLLVIDEMGQRIPILDLMTALAALQWILGPYIEYRKTTHHYKYFMYVPEETYMSFVVPSIIAFRIGIGLFKNQSDLDNIGSRVNKLLEDYPKLPYYLIVGGFILPYLSPILPSALGFVFYLLSNAKYIGVIYLLFSGKPNRWPVFWVTMAFTAAASIAMGMFHDLLLWAMLLFTFVAREMHLTFFRKLAIAVIGIFFALTIQSVKAEYRELTWGRGYQGNRVTLFLGLALNQWTSRKIITPSSDADMNVRLNQGWIISAIMKNVPEQEPFANGSTITEGIKSALLPRVLAPNKKKAGGQENFRKFTGLEIGNNTSMGISIVGEGYANYGYGGGIAFMFFWGLFLGWFWRKLSNLSTFYPTLLIWSPILFLQVVKAETEFVVVLNHLLKASVLVFGLLWFIKRQWGIRI